MADRTRDKGKVPPPVPTRPGSSGGFPRAPTGTPISSPAPKSELAFETDESTQQLVSPLAMAAMEELCIAIRAEIKYTEKKDGRSENVVELNAQLAMVYLQTAGEIDKCLRHCEQGTGHETVTAILRSLAQGAKSSATFRQYSEQLLVQQEGKSSSLCALKAMIARAWLFRFCSAQQALDLAFEAMADGLDSEVLENSGPLGLETVYCISLSILEKWEELAKFYSDKNSSTYHSELAALELDRLDNSARALEQIQSVQAESPEVALYVSTLQAQILSTSDATPAKQVEYLQARLQLLEGEAKTSAESNATLYALAQMQELAGDYESAQKTFVQLTTKTGWSTSIAQLSALRVAYKQEDWKVVVAQLGKLSTLANEAALAIAHGRRRAEILECFLGQRNDALRTWQIITEEYPDSSTSRRNILRLLVDKPKELLAQVLKQSSKSERDQLENWRLAVGIQESRVGETTAAAKLAEQCLTASRLASDPGLVDDLWTVSRFRALEDDDAGVAKAYMEIVDVLSESKCVVSLRLVVGILELRAGNEAKAVAHLEETAKQFPDALAPLLVLASIHKSNSDTSGIRKVLHKIAEVAQCEDNKFDALVQLGELCMTLNDHAGARSSLTKAAEIRPKDVGLLRTLAGLHESNHEWKRAVALFLQCAEYSEDPSEASKVLAQAGKLEWEKNGNLVAGIENYERSLELVSNNVEVLQASQAIYGKLGQPEKELAMYQAELQITEEGLRRLTLHLEIGRSSVLAKEAPASILQAFQQALTLDPNNELGLAGLLQIARDTKNWNSIVHAFDSAKTTPSNLEILADACRNLKDWRRYVDVQGQYILLLPPSEHRAELSVDLATICETELRDNELAILAYRQALEFQPSLAVAHTSLRRLLSEKKDWPELVKAIDSELQILPESKHEESVQLRLILARVYRDELGNKNRAIEAFERILTTQSENKEALSELETLYTTLGRDTDLLRIKVSQMSTVATSELTRQIADLRAKTGDVNGAIKAYQASFNKDVANREMFSVLEKICYENERWTEVLDLYTEVIANVENGSTQAYRLADLYSRRGQVQLQYTGQSVMATASFLRVIEIEPANHAAMQALSAIFSGSGDWESLIAAYEKRAELCSNQDLKLESYREAAELARVQTKDREEMVRFYKMVLKLAPGDTEIREKCELHYTETSNWAELILILESELARVEASGEVDVALLKRVAKVSEEGLRDENRAIRYYKQIVEHVPHSRRSLDALARIYETTERWMEFVDVTRRLVKVTKDRNVKALLYFKCGSVTEAKFGNEDDAIRYYDAAIKTSPSCLPAVHGLRDLYLRQKEWARVIQTLELEVKLWQDDKERAGVFAQIGRIYGAELHQPERALSFYKRALEVSTDCVPANRAMFEHYFELRYWDKAEVIAKSFSAKAMREGEPEVRSEFYRKRGIVSMHTGNPTAAAESIVAAIEINQENIAALQSLTGLAAEFPLAYNFAQTFKGLSKIYKKRGGTQNLQAQVMVGESHILMRSGNLQAADNLLQKAIELSGDDLTVALALVELHSSMRNWTLAIAVLENLLSPGVSIEVQVQVLMKMATLYSEGPMDSARAVVSLQRILPIQGNNPEVFYLLAQELYCMERFEDAHAAIERVIELSAGPDLNLSAERLARYTYFLGRILEKEGDSRAATSQYRRAAEYDPGYAPPALALAHHAMTGGDQQGAESRLISSALAAIENGDNQAAVSMQRGLARILLKGGDQAAAIEAYRGILEVEPGGAADRLSLAEIYAQSDLHRATREVHLVIQHSLRHGPAYRVLAGYYMLAGKAPRAVRALVAMRLLGYSEAQDERMEESARSVSPAFRLVRALTPELRMSYLANDSLRSVLAELFALCHQQMSILNRRVGLGENLLPLPSVGNSVLAAAADDMVKLFGIEPEIYVGENVPGRIVVIGHPRVIVVLDQAVASQPEASLRFALGWAFEGLCAGFASLLHIGEKQRLEIGHLMRSLFVAESERSAGTNEFVATLPPRAHEILTKHEGEFQNVDIDAWVDGMNAVARRAGLLACDDLAAAAQTLAVISGETSDAQSERLGTVFCGEDLFQFQVSDEYAELRSALSDVNVGVT